MWVVGNNQVVKSDALAVTEDWDEATGALSEAMEEHYTGASEEAQDKYVAALGKLDAATEGEPFLTKIDSVTWWILEAREYA